MLPKLDLPLVMLLSVHLSVMFIVCLSFKKIFAKDSEVNK